MRYWFFNGEDVVGPLAAQELASVPGFVATSLICPEHASVNAESWQPAARFTEFHFDDVTGKLALVSARETSSSRPRVRVRKRPTKPAKPVASEFIRLSRVKKTTPAPTPVALAKGEAVELVLPQNTATKDPNPAQKNPPLTAKPSRKTAAPAKVPPENYLSSCVLPVVPDKMNEEKLPPLPEGDVPLPTASQSGFDMEEDILFSQPSLQEESALANKSPEEETQETAFSSSAQEGETWAREAESFFEPKVSQVKARLVPTPEIEEFLTDHNLAFRPKHKGRSQLALLMLLVLLLPGLMGLLMQAGCISLKSPAVATPAASGALGKEAVEELTQSPAVAAAQPAEQGASLAQEKALAAVQNYVLPGNRGTISSYFARLYQERLQQGYTASWSAEPLHNDIYIVKYRIAKTRTEPIVYVFQADVKKNRLTGALNNAALDLVGKI